MYLRRWILPALLTLPLLLILLLPATGPGRNWLLSQVQGFVANTGYTLEYDTASGYAWRSVTLHDAQITGPGADIAVERLEVSYFLPGLLGGELPFSAFIEGVSGELDTSQLELPEGGGGGPSIVPRLRELGVERVALDVGGVPWDLPDLSVTDVSLGQDSGRIIFAGTLLTPLGSGSLEGAVNDGFDEVQAVVQDASLSLVNHWWPHVEAGTASGRLAYNAETGFYADLQLQNGEVLFQNFHATRVSGPVRFDSGLVNASLTGDIMGGRAQVEAQVNVPAQNWQASGTGNAGLAQLLATFAPELPVDAQLEGDARYELSGSGWDQFTLSGNGRGSGEASVSGIPVDLAELETEFNWNSSRGLTMTLLGVANSGTFTTSVTPEEGAAQEVILALQGVALPGGLLESGQARLITGSRLTGEAQGRVLVEVAGTPLAATVEASMGEDGIGVFLSGSARGGSPEALLAGTRFEGAAVLDDGQIEGQVNLNDLVVPELDAPVQVSLAATGPLERPRLTLELDGPAAPLEITGFTLDAPLAGSLSGTLSPSYDRLEDVSGRLGPLQLSGEVALSPLAAQFDLSTAPFSVAGPATVAVEGGSGTITYRDGELVTGADLHVARVEAAGAQAGPLALAVQANYDAQAGARLEASGTAQGQQVLALTYDPSSTPSLAVNASGLRVEYEEQELLANGTLELGETGPAANLEVTSGELSLAVRPDGQGHALSLVAPAGTRVAGLELGEELSLQGQVDREFNRAQLELIEGDRTFTLTASLDTGTFSGGGDLDVGQLGALLGVPLAGQVSGSLDYGPEGYGGEVHGNVEIAGLPASLSLRGAGDELQVSGTAELLDEWTLAGTVWPQVRLSAQSPTGSLTFAEGTVSGSGPTARLAAQLAPELELPAGLAESQWTLEADLAEQRGRLDLAGHTVDADWSAGFASLVATARVGGENIEVRAQDGAWLLSGAPRVAPLLAAVGMQLEELLPIPADMWEVDPEELRLQVEATASLEEGLAAQGSWALLAPDEPALTGTASYDGEWRVEAGLPGGQVSAGPQGIALDAIDLQPEALLASLPLSLELPAQLAGTTVSGNLLRSFDGTWQGSLRVNGGEAVPLRGQDGRSLLTLVGSGNELLLTSEAQLAGEGMPAVGLSASGALLPELDLSATVDTPWAAGQFGVTGPLQRPQLQGSLSSEPLQAGFAQVDAVSVDVQANLDEGLAAQLSGEGVQVSITPQAVTGRLAVPVQLGDALGSTTVNLQLDAQLTGGSPVWRVSGNTPLELLGEQVTVRAYLEGEGASYSGLATAATGEGQLLQASLAGEGAQWHLSGNLAHSDRAALAALLPVHTTLSAEGGFEAGSSIDPRANVQLAAQVAAGPGVAVDLAATLDGEELDARGRAALEEGALLWDYSGTITSLLESDTLVATGEGQLQGWEVAFHPGEGSFFAVGELAGLDDSLAGLATVQLAPDGSVDGSITGLNLAGMHLGDIGLSAGPSLDSLQVDGEAFSGRLTSVEELGWEIDRIALPLTGELQLAGSASGNAAAGVVQLELTGSVAGEPVDLPVQLEFDLAGGESGGMRLSAAGSGLLAGSETTLNATLDGMRVDGEARLNGLNLGGLDLDLYVGVAGDLQAGRPLTVGYQAQQTGDAGVSLTGSLDLGSALQGTPAGLNARLEAFGGSLTASGVVDPLPLLGGTGEEYRSRTDLNLRLGTFDPATLPAVAQVLPHLEAPLSGFLQVRGNDVIGRLTAPDLAVAGEVVPFDVDIGGNLGRVQLTSVFAGSPLNVTIDGRGVTGRATLEAFPLEVLARAVVGPAPLDASVTGVARLSLPWEAGEGLEFEVATEQIRMESGGVTTTGTFNATLREGRFVVTDAQFTSTEGDEQTGEAGRWVATGTIAPDLLDFRLTAQDADFTPLLGLIPPIAQYGVGAQGTLEVEASGTFAEPRVTAASEEIAIEVAGTLFRLDDLLARLAGEDLTVAGTAVGITPVTGELDISGQARLVLSTMDLSGATFQLEGDAYVPWLGQITALGATIQSTEQSPLWLEGGGQLGQPFSVEGSLVPLDLRVQGDDLAISFPQLMVASARVDADVYLRWQEEFLLGGHVFVDEARFQMGLSSGQSSAEGEAAAPQPGVAQQAATDEDDDLAQGGEISRLVDESVSSQALERFQFDGLRIEAPGRVRFNENFGNAELAMDIRLVGTAAQPALSGAAQVLRGALRFSGREFQVVSAVATFDPSRGIYPVLDVVARTSLDASRIASSNRGISFVSGLEGNRVEVTLAFTAQVEPVPDQSPPFELNITPSLASPVLFQETLADGSSTAPREFTETELLSLITLGRIELDAPIAGESGLGTALAEGALDTAVDMLFVSELQSALAEALGLDVVEIQTTALSSVLDRERGDPFSVSLRLGGYLSDEVFASYRIGRFDDSRGIYSLTNEVNIVYELGPLELDLAGRVNFEDSPTGAGPAAELSAALRYDVYEHIGLETGVDFSDERQQVRFGLTIRW